MRKLTVMMALFAVVVGVAAGVEPVLFEIVGRFPVGGGKGQFGHTSTPQSGDDTSVPRALSHGEPFFIVGDNVNNRIVKFSIAGEWHATSDRVYPGLRSIANEQYAFFFGNSGSYQVFDQQRNQVLKSNRMSGDFGNATDYVRAILMGDMIIAQSSFARDSTTPRYFGFYIPDDFDGNITMMNPEQTIRFLKEEYQGTEDFRVDRNGYIFWNGKLVAPYGYSYARYYWNTNRPTTEWQATILFSQFIGWDLVGNTYWSDHRTISVLSPQGESLAFFEAGNVAESARSQFAVTPEGTLYCLSYNADRNEFELMKLERFW